MKHKIYFLVLLDGPVKYDGTVNEDLKIKNVTKFGRSFSIVKVPYSLKLMIQELQTMNIQMRIITEDNIDQIMNLAFTDQYKTLTKEYYDNISYVPESILNVGNSINQMMRRGEYTNMEGKRILRRAC